MIRRQHPVLKQQQIPDVHKQTQNQRQKEKNDIRKELGIYVAPPKVPVDPNSPNIYKNMDDEGKTKHNKFMAQHITGKRGKDKSFKKESVRISRMCMSELRGTFKTCTICGETKGQGAFDLMRTKHRKYHTYRPYCYQCRKKKNQEYYRKNKEKWEHINDHRRISE